MQRETRRPSPRESTISIGNYNGNLRPEFISNPPRAANPSKRNPRYNDEPQRKRCLRHSRQKKDFYRKIWRHLKSRFETSVRRKHNFFSSFFNFLVSLIGVNQHYNTNMWYWYIHKTQPYPYTKFLSIIQYFRI